jgi:hypothetical protein
MTASGCARSADECTRTIPVWTGERSRLGDLLLVLFLLAQCFDGVLTYVGVMTFGIGIEANPLITNLMLYFGEGTGLLGAKLVAAALGIALHLRRVHIAVAILTAFYFGAAVLPWAAILFGQQHLW